MRRLTSRRAWPAIGLVAVAIVAAACASGSAANPGANQSSSELRLSYDTKGPIAAASAAAGVPEPQAGPDGGSGSENWRAPNAAPLDQPLIVKTGQLTLEVADLDKAITQAQATVVGMGGYVAQTSKSGTGATATAAITYRIPAARWDDALAALGKLANKVVGEQTNTADVTAQVVDLEARLTNLQATERALQGIMAKATTISDILAVEQQLSQVQGQIEQLTAQRDRLKDQAAMSTLAVAYQLPGAPVVTATRDWSISAEIDQAIAALVRVGQGLATVAVWAAIVLLPIGLGLLIVLGFAFFFLRRVLPVRSPVAAPERPEA